MVSIVERQFAVFQHGETHNGSPHTSYALDTSAVELSKAAQNTIDS
jgi:hypothetical protein